jgi:glycosyltransferase involved in cell wall biosynthesis
VTDGQLSSPRRIALVTQGYEAGGGVATVAQWLHKALTSAGYEVEIHDLAASVRDSASRRILAPATWFRPTLSRPLVGPANGCHWGANAVELELLRYRRRGELTRALAQFDLVQVVAGGPALANVTIGCGVPVVVQAATLAAWERGPRMQSMPRVRRAWWKVMTALIARTERRALSSAQAVLVWNTAMRDEVQRYSNGELRLAFPGTDVQRFRPIETGWQRKGPLLSVCRLGDGRKRIDLLIRAFASMVQVDPTVPDLMLAGKGQLPTREVALIKELGVESRVHVWSDVSADDLPDLYRRASIYLQASQEEGFGVSVVEAMCSGLPVVTTQTAGTKMTVLHGRTGWLIPLGDSQAVAEQLATRCLTVLQGEGADMSREARKHAVDSFSSDAALRQFTRLYDEMLESR